MRARALPLATLVLGLLTLATLLWLGMSPEVAAVYERSEVGAAVSEFQRAETPADLARVFGDPPNPAILAAQDVVNTRDLYAFIPAYALFLVVAALMISAGVRGPLTWAAIAFALLGAGADAIETTLQLRITADTENAAEYLPVAPWHWAKYVALGLNGAAIAAICFVSTPKRWIMGLLALAPLPFVLAAWAGFSSPRLFSAAFGAYWIAILVLAAIESVRGRGAQA
ncbi:MAG: hypothetical protein ACT4OF_10495 [Caulobacteraceae bacterium]